MTAIPKGGMCVACTKCSDDCSGKDFDAMQVIKKYPDGVKAVKCVDFDSAKPRGAVDSISFRQGVAHAASYFQDLTGRALTENIGAILKNVEEQAIQRGGDFGAGMQSVVVKLREVISKTNAVASA